jgi:hypothetical protein
VVELQRRYIIGYTPAKKLHDDLAEYRWRPIETAPKDWSNIILYLPEHGGDVVQGYYDCDSEGWRCMAGNNTGHNELCLPPSHWMPLPNPPNKQICDPSSDA